MALATSFFKIERRIKEDTNHLNIMQSARTLFLAALVLISSLIAGCGCLAAQSYAQPACQKYQTYAVQSWHRVRSIVIEEGLITREEFMAKIANERQTHQ